MPWVFAPQHFAAGCVEAGDDASDAQGYDLSIRHGGRASGPRVSAGRAADRLGGVLVPPDFLAVGGLEAHGDLFFALSRKGIELIADKRGRGDALTHRGFPFLRQFSRPFCRRGEPAGLAIAIWSSPLRPILGQGAGSADRNKAADDHNSR